MLIIIIWHNLPTGSFSISPLFTNNWSYLSSLLSNTALSQRKCILILIFRADTPLSLWRKEQRGFHLRNTFSFHFEDSLHDSAWVRQDAMYIKDTCQESWRGQWMNYVVGPAGIGGGLALQHLTQESREPARFELSRLPGPNSTA